MSTPASVAAAPAATPKSSGPAYTPNPNKRSGALLGVLVHRDRAREAAVHRVVAQQMGVRLDRAEVVDRHHLDVGAPRFDDRPQHVAPDPAEPVDRYLHSHDSLLPVQCPRLSCRKRGENAMRGEVGRGIA